MNRTLLFLPLAVLLACSKKEEGIQYGDPIGIRLSGTGDAPGYEIAIAVNKGKDIGQSVNTVAGAIYVATKACPEVATITGAGKVLRIKLVVEAGKVKAPAQLPEESAAACLIKALDGRPLVAGSEKLDVLAEIRGAEGAPK
jgi:hypothetical protein